MVYEVPPSFTPTPRDPYSPTLSPHSLTLLLSSSLAISRCTLSRATAVTAVALSACGTQGRACLRACAPRAYLYHPYVVASRATRLGHPCTSSGARYDYEVAHEAKLHNARRPSQGPAPEHGQQRGWPP